MNSSLNNNNDENNNNSEIKNDNNFINPNKNNDYISQECQVNDARENKSFSGKLHYPLFKYVIAFVIVVFIVIGGFIIKDKIINNSKSIFSNNKDLDNNTKVSVYETDLKYFEFENKKFYLTIDPVSYIMQFKGMGCSLSDSSSNIASSFALDDVNDDSHKFYSWNSKSPTINCGDPENILKFSNYLHLQHSTYNDPITKGTIDYWGFYADKKDSTIFMFNQGKVILDYNEKKCTTITEIKKLFGDNYKEEYNIHGVLEKIEYKINDVTYRFGIDVDSMGLEVESDKVDSIYISI